MGDSKRRKQTIASNYGQPLTAELTIYSPDSTPLITIPFIYTNEGHKALNKGRMASIAIIILGLIRDPVEINKAIALTALGSASFRALMDAREELPAQWWAKCTDQAGDDSYFASDEGILPDEYAVDMQSYYPQEVARRAIA